MSKKNNVKSITTSLFYMLRYKWMNEWMNEFYITFCFKQYIKQKYYLLFENQKD